MSKKQGTYRYCRKWVIIELSYFGQRFLDTDLIIIDMDFKNAWIFHHEGVYGLVEFDPA